MPTSYDVTLCLPFPPSLNHYWRNVAIKLKSGRAISKTTISKRGREFRKETMSMVAEQGISALCMKSRLRVIIYLHPPDKRKRDIDNYAKALLDALTHSQVWLDDSQIDELQIVRGEIKKPGECLVHIGDI